MQERSFELNDLGRRFKDASASLVQITFEGTLEEGNSQYGVLYAKATQRLAATLCVDREILVLTSRFSDQQVRTIDAALQVIDNSSGRLEPNMVIIIHADQRGSNKLKNWGRERGLTVLPVYAGIEKWPQGERFESLLSAELFSHDPFDVTGPVADDFNFFGRRTEAQEFARKLQSGQIRACFGIRKIGKTSILNRIVRECEEHYDCLCLVLDCSRDEIWSSSAGDLLESLTVSLEQARVNGKMYSSVELTKTQGELTAVARRLGDAIASVGKPVIVFLDEIDYIGPGSPTTNLWRTEFNPFWRTVRAIYQENTRTTKNLSLFVSGVSSKWFSKESIEGIENSALGLVPEEYLVPLARGASIAMIKTMARRAGIQISDEVGERIASTCSDIPFWMRKACSYVHRQVPVDGRPLALAANRADQLLHEFVESDGPTFAGVALRHLFRVFPELVSACKSISEGSHTSSPQSLIKTLEKYGIIRFEGKSPMLSGPMIRAGWKWYCEDQASATDLERSNLESSVTAGQIQISDDSIWADELAMLGRRRNILEKTLRHTIVNFYKLDSLKNKQKGAPLERILSALPKERRSELSSLTPIDVMQKLFWKELVQIVERDWELFGQLFSDKNAFKLNAMIVNDRPDSHAKEVDMAEIALHRRALEWLEKKVLN